jgi:hypothetical protein
MGVVNPLADNHRCGILLRLFDGASFGKLLWLQLTHHCSCLAAEFDREIMNEFGEMGMLGVTLEGYGCAGASSVCAMEGARARFLAWRGWSSGFCDMRCLFCTVAHGRH